MNVLCVSGSDYQKVMTGEQKYCWSNYGPVDKKFLKKCDKDTKKTIKQCNKEIKNKCKSCVNFDKKDPCDISNYSYVMSKVCRDCGRSFEWKNYKPKE